MDDVGSVTDLQAPHEGEGGVDEIEDDDKWLDVDIGNPFIVMLTEEVLNEMVLVGVRLMMGCLLMPITHHCLEPHRFAVQVFCRGDLTAKDAVVAVLLKLAREDQTGAKE